MKVLFATPYGGVPGGISRWAEHIVQYHDSVNDDVTLDLLPMGRSVFVNINSSIPYRIVTAFKDYSSIIKDFQDRIRKNQYDIMHLASSGSLSLLKDLYMLRLAHNKKIKVLVHFHYGRIPELYKKNNWEWHLIQKVIKKADGVIVIDKLSYDTLIKIGFSNIYYVPNPISPKVLSIVNQNSGILRKPKHILFVGHVVKTKGVYELVSACKEIQGISLSLVGHANADVKSELERIAQGKWLQILGELPYEEVIKKMLSCDLFILPTYTEGFPNVILESMACGCVIIASRVGAIPEMLDADGQKCGILISPKSVIQIKKAIDDVLLNTIYKDQLRQNAVDRVVKCYGMDKVWKQMSLVWEKIINS